MRILIKKNWLAIISKGDTGWDKNPVSKSTSFSRKCGEISKTTKRGQSDGLVYTMVIKGLIDEGRWGAQEITGRN